MDEKQPIIPTPESDPSVEPSVEVPSPIERGAKRASQPSSAPPQDEIVPEASTVASQPSAQTQFFQDKTQMRRDIERVLEEDLDDLYRSLSEKQRQQFRIEGEQTAAKIESLLKNVKVKLVEIINLITGWLKLLPGVNGFFLEQEAKIKAEKILFLKKEEIM